MREIPLRTIVKTIEPPAGAPPDTPPARLRVHTEAVLRAIIDSAPREGHPSAVLRRDLEIQVALDAALKAGAAKLLLEETPFQHLVARERDVRWTEQAGPMRAELVALLDDVLTAPKIEVEAKAAPKPPRRKA